MNASRTARERARAELVAEILAAARRQLAQVGGAALSMRAVSRELGMVSSALHRYFPTRDALLTALIVQGYDDLADAVEATEDPDADPATRWRAIARAVRAWALANPHEYALIYGTPVPGYEAPTETVPAAARTAAPLGRVLVDAHAAGLLTVVPGRGLDAADAARLSSALEVDGVPDAVLPGALSAWTGLLGHVSFELFGQFTNVVSDRETLFDAVVERLTNMIGLSP